MSENYSNPKITNPIIPPQPSDYIEEYTEPVQEPKNDGGEGDGGNDKPTPKHDNEKPQPKPDDESHHEEDAPKPEEDAPKPEETEPKEEDEEEGVLEEQNPIEDKDDAQGNFFEDNKGLLTRVYNILKLRFPNSNVSLSELLTGAQQYIDMIAAPPGGGGQGGGEGQEESNSTRYSIYIDNQTKPIEAQRYTYDPQKTNQYMWNFMEKKCIDLFWADSKKQRFNDAYIKKVDGKWQLRSITIEFKDDVLVNSETKRFEIFRKQMYFLHGIDYTDYSFIQDKQKKSTVYTFNFYKYGEDEDIAHAFELARKDESGIKNEIKDSRVNNKNIAKYLNAVYKEFERRKNEIKLEANNYNDNDKKKYIFRTLVTSLSYDGEGFNKDFQFSNNMRSALATNFAQCHGYAGAFSIIANELKIDMSFIGSIDYKHAWNYEITTQEGFWYDACFQKTGYGKNEDKNSYYYFKFKNDRRDVYIDATKIVLCSLKEGIPIFDEIPDDKNSSERKVFFEKFEGETEGETEEKAVDDTNQNNGPLDSREGT